MLSNRMRMMQMMSGSNMYSTNIDYKDLKRNYIKSYGMNQTLKNKIIARAKEDYANKKITLQ